MKTGLIYHEPRFTFALRGQTEKAFCEVRIYRPSNAPDHIVAIASDPQDKLWYEDKLYAQY